MGISKEQIIESSIKILNSSGVGSLTMRTLAKELDIKAASIYWHIKDKTSLLGLIAESICEQIKVSASMDEPKKYLYELNSKYRSKLLEVRDSVEIFIHSDSNTPTRNELKNNTLDCLSKIGVKDENLLTAANMLNSFVLSFVAEEVRFKSAANEELDPGEQRFGKWSAKSLFYYESQFLYGLEVLFAGLKSISPQM